MRLRWTPKATHRADPGEVFHEAAKDAEAGRHELALSKHLWFHKHSIRFRPSLAGVRRSYALSAWVDLSKKYAPAHAALLRVRNAAGRSVWKDKDPWHAFHDFTSINQYLKEVQRTAELFEKLDRRSPLKAKRVYSLAEPVLVRAGNFKLCGRYLEPNERFATIRRTYRVNLRLSKDPTIGMDLVDFAQRSFAEKAIRLVALLALNGRTKEAKNVGRKACRVWNNAQFHSRIASAELGRF